MHVIKRGKLVEFWERHPDSRPALEAWYAVTRKAQWRSPVELRRVYPSADPVGRRTVFDIGGNKYRLIARVNYRTQRVFVLYVLTHAEYDRGRWKEA